MDTDIGEKTKEDSGCGYFVRKLEGNNSVKCCGGLFHNDVEGIGEIIA